MTLDTFFKKFDQFADAPNAVAKMRELVLELASKGALSERRVSDQADAAWSKFTTEFDSQGNRSEQILPFEIPKVWRWVSLNDLGTTKVRNEIADDTLVSFVPMTLISAKYGEPAKSEERSWGEVKKGFTHFGEGDVVMAKITPCFENAKSAVMRNLVNGVGAGTTELLVFRGETKIIIPEFVLLYLKTRGFIMRGEPRMTGSAGQKRVPREYFAGSPFPLPPLAEQKRIVAKVDELMALCDRLEAQQQERQTRHADLARASLARFAAAPTPANLHFLFHKSYTIPPADLRKSILTLAVQGKLVPQDPKDEPAVKLLIKAEQIKAKWAGPITEQEVPFHLPPSWMWYRLGDISSLKHGYAFSSEFFTSKPAPFVLTTPGNFFEKGGFRDRESKRKYFSGQVDPAFIFKPGDLIIPMTEQAAGLLGSPAFIPDDGRIYIHNQRLGKVNFSESIAPEFAFWFFNCDFFRGELARTCTGMKVRHTSPDRVLKIPFPLPSLAEQRRIVAKVEQLMALVDELETQIAASRTTAKNLLEAVVAELT